LLGESMGGGVATECAARRCPHCPLVNLRSFASLAHVSASVVGLPYSLLPIVRLVLATAYGRLPWRPPLESAAHWSALRPGHRLLVYHEEDEVIGHVAGLHTVIADDDGGLDRTVVIRLRGDPVQDAHNEDPAAFSPKEWREALGWMRAQLALDEPHDEGSKKER
jgi:pimeloyl-ACP methyl ester carboxylesterase